MGSSSRLSLHAAKAAPKPEGFRARRTRGLTLAAQTLGSGVHNKRWKGLGQYGGGPGIVYYQLYYKNAFGVALLLIRMTAGHKQGSKRGEQV